jgi:cobalamin biosynthesis Mg chelatase CobN
MAEDWFADVRKYAAGANPDHVAGIVRYCGIALRKRDSALVSFSSPEETARVRENFLKKKLALSDPDSVLDEAIAAVGERMKADRTKNRVTVYYLLADRFGRLDDFLKTSKSAAAKATASAPAGRERAANDERAAARQAEPEAQPQSAAGFQPQARPAAAVPAPFGAGTAQPSTFGSKPRAGDSTGEAQPSVGESVQFAAASSQTGSRWWLWLLLLIVVIIVLWLLLR